MKNRLLLLSVFLLAGVISKAQNLITNGDFENSDGWIDKFLQ